VLCRAVLHRGRKVHDVNPKRPQSAVGPHSLSLVSAVCGVWPLMLLGDADGTLMAWDLLHGRCSSMQTGEGEGWDECLRLWFYKSCVRACVRARACMANRPTTPLKTREDSLGAPAHSWLPVAGTQWPPARHAVLACASLADSSTRIALTPCAPLKGVTRNLGQMVVLCDFGA
jgi:hypothetical protein